MDVRYLQIGLLRMRSRHLLHINCTYDDRPSAKLLARLRKNRGGGGAIQVDFERAHNMAHIQECEQRILEVCGCRPYNNIT